MKYPNQAKKDISVRLSETVEGVLQDQFYQWFKQYWAEKAETVSRQSFLDIVNRAPQIEPPLEADRL